MAIVKVDPEEFEKASTVQIDSDAGDMWLAVGDVEDWASAHGFVRTHEFNLRVILIDGKRRYRGICYRISQEEVAAMGLAQREMIERAESLRGLVTAADRRRG